MLLKAPRKTVTMVGYQDSKDFGIDDGVDRTEEVNFVGRQGNF